MTDNLWDILYKLLSEQSYEPDMVPIVIYLKQEFIGEEILKQVVKKIIIMHFGMSLCTVAVSTNFLFLENGCEDLRTSLLEIPKSKAFIPNS